MSLKRTNLELAEQESFAILNEDSIQTPKTLAQALALRGFVVSKEMAQLFLST